jgi:hypothetical protein
MHLKYCCINSTYFRVQEALINDLLYAPCIGVTVIFLYETCLLQVLYAENMKICSHSFYSSFINISVTLNLFCRAMIAQLV